MMPSLVENDRKESSSNTSKFSGSGIRDSKLSIWIEIIFITFFFIYVCFTMCAIMLHQKKEITFRRLIIVLAFLVPSMMPEVGIRRCKTPVAPDLCVG